MFVFAFKNRRELGLELIFDEIILIIGILTIMNVMWNKIFKIFFFWSVQINFRFFGSHFKENSKTFNVSTWITMWSRKRKSQFSVITFQAASFQVKWQFWTKFLCTKIKKKKRPTTLPYSKQNTTRKNQNRK